MATEENYLDDSKEVKVKGIETAPIVEENGEKEIRKQDDIDIMFSKPTPKALEYKEPTSLGEAVSTNIARGAGGTSVIKGSPSGYTSELVNQVFAPVDLAVGIPDAAEREKFISDNGEHLVNLFDDTVGFTFMDEAVDLLKFKEKQYPLRVKKFIDDLDEAQGIFAETSNTILKAAGLLATNVLGGLVGTTYGLGSMVANGFDLSKLFDNVVFDALEWAEEGINKQTVIYGGSDVWDFVINPDTGVGDFYQKDFIFRLGSDPLKSLNQDIVPAASMVAGAVVTELIASSLTLGSLGAAAPALAANTARITNQFSKWGNRINKFGKANRIIRGIDDVPGAAAANIERLTNTYRQGLGTLSSAYRSSAYESGLIARDITEGTYEKLLSDHEAREGRPPTQAEIIRYRELADSAGVQGFFMNIPLVAGSNFIQFPSVFRRNYKTVSSARGKLDNLKLSGTRIKDGKFISNVDANKWLKTLGYAKAGLAKGFAEGFEEFGQGVIENGLVDYFASNYSDDTNRNALGLIDSIAKKSTTYLNSVEGRDSVSIGFLMGLLGIRLPFKTDPNTGKTKLSLRGTGFGGARQAIKEYRENIAKARKTAETLNNSDTTFNPILKENFKNHMSHIQSMRKMDVAANQGNIYEYKNAEFDSIFSFIKSRSKLGLGSSVLQELDALEKMPIDKFNEVFGTKGLDEYTEETKAEVLKSARVNSMNILKAIDDTQLLINRKQDLGLIPKAISKAWQEFRGKKSKLSAVDLYEIRENIVDQMAYLKAKVQNSVKREKELTQQIQDIISRVDPQGVSGLNIAALNELVTQIVNINPEIRNNPVQFNNRKKEVKAAILKEWKENNPNTYNDTIVEVEPLIDDILKLKEQRAEASKMYQKLFTPKGIEAFVKLNMGFKNASNESKKKHAKDIINKNLDNRRNAKTANTQEDEKSIFGNSSMSDKKIEEDIVNGVKEYEKIEADKKYDNVSKQSKVIQVLERFPGLLVEIKNRLEERGIPVEGTTTAKEIQLRDKDGNIMGPLLEEFQNIIDEVKQNEIDIANNFKADKANQLGNAVPSGGTFDTEGEVEDIIKEAPKRNTEAHTIASTYDKSLIKEERPIKNIEGEIIGTKSVWTTQKDSEGKATAKHKVFVNKKDQKENYPIDNDFVNSWAFLNNKDLESGNHRVKLVRQDSEYNNRSGINSDNMRIDMFHINPKTKEETFIGWLPQAFAYSPNQLIELRKAVLENYETMGPDIEVDPVNIKDSIQEVKKEIENIEKKLQENLDAKKEDSLTDKLKAEEERQTLLDKIKPNTLTKKERKLIIAKALLKGKSLKEAQKEAGYVEVQGIMIAPDAPIEILKLADQVIWEALVARGISYIETSDSDGHGAALSHSKNNKTYAWGIDLSKGLINFFKEKSKDFPGDTKSRINHVLAHELGHKVWQNDLTDAQKQIVENTKEKADYVKRLEEGTVKSSAGSVEENFTENFAWDLTKKLTGESERSVFTELQELMDDINSDVVSDTTQPTTEVTEETTVESKIKEVEKNKDFIKLSDNENNYVNTKTGKVYQRVSSFIAIVEITDKEYKDFVDNGIVSPIIINSIVEKIKTGIELTTQEQAIRKEKAEEIEEALIENSTLKSSQTIGTKVDELVRDFFADEEIDLSKYNVSSKEETKKFLEELQKIKDKMKKDNEKVLSNDIVLYNDEIGVAGTVDLLTYDNKGVVRIYDMKTMRGNNFTEYYARHTANKYETTVFGKSKKQKHTEQLSMYRMLLNNTHGLKAKELKIIPIEISYKGGDTTTSKLNLLETVELKPLDKIKNAELTLTKVDSVEDAEQAELKSQLDDLNNRLKNLISEVPINLDTEGDNIFTSLQVIKKIPKNRREKVKEEIENKFGKEFVNRAEFIEKNFEDIISKVENAATIEFRKECL